jgi:hypothetical protein
MVKLGTILIRDRVVIIGDRIGKDCGDCVDLMLDYSKGYVTNINYLAERFRLQICLAEGFPQATEGGLQ